MHWRAELWGGQVRRGLLHLARQDLLVISLRSAVLRELHAPRSRLHHELQLLLRARLELWHLRRLRAVPELEGRNT